MIFSAWIHAIASTLACQCAIGLFLAQSAPFYPSCARREPAAWIPHRIFTAESLFNRTIWLRRTICRGKTKLAPWYRDTPKLQARAIQKLRSLQVKCCIQKVIKTCNQNTPRTFRGHRTSRGHPIGIVKTTRKTRLDVGLSFAWRCRGHPSPRTS